MSDADPDPVAEPNRPRPRPCCTVPHLPRLARPLPPGVEELTVVRDATWPNDSKIRVAFQGGSPLVNGRVLEHANAWSAYAAIDFIPAIPGREYDVLVGYSQPGYWSLVGPPRGVVRGQPTLNLQGFDDLQFPPPESEWKRVVIHEFGHVLGALHEQQRPEIVALLDRAACLAYFERTQGWTAQEVEDQILQPTDMSRMIASDPDQRSIMEYEIPGICTLSGQPIVGGSDLTDKDKATIARLYPGRLTPVVPPIVVPPPVVIVTPPPTAAPPPGPEFRPDGSVAYPPGRTTIAGRVFQVRVTLVPEPL